MKKIIRKFWGVALVVMLLSSLLVIPATPAAAGDYAFSADLTQPSAVNGLLGGFNFLDVAQSGSTIYATTSLGWLYMSPDGGGMWIPINTTLAVGTYSLVAVAPDDPLLVAIVDTAPAADVVWLSSDGGVTFASLGSPGAVVNSIDISASIGVRYIAVGGNNGAGVGFVQSWTLGVVAPGWAAPLISVGGNAFTACNDVDAVTFSPNFPADAGLVVVTEHPTTTFDVNAEVYSYNLGSWNPLGTNFPRQLTIDSALGAIACNRATIALDSNFYLGDEATQIGFIGASITDTVNAEVGGIYRFDYVAAANNPLVQILGSNSAAGGTAIYSVAWDGTNLMAGDMATTPIRVLRSANALATAGWAFLPNSALKTPGTGTLPLVLFNGDNGYCFSSGTNAAVARTTDYGKTFNGIALVNSNFNNVIDFWMSADATRMYVLTDDATDVNVWRKSAGIWERVMILAAATGQTWMVRAAQSDPDAVYLARQGAATMYKSLDAGEALWTPRACNNNIQDFAVQSATVLYVAVAGGSGVVSSTNGAFGWSPLPIATGIGLFGDTCYSINLIADNQLLVGGNLGTVAYSTDGNATWALILAYLGNGGPTAPTLVTASGLATGDVIWAADTNGNLGMWTIGVSVPAPTGLGWAMDTVDPLVSITGLVYTNGILYAWDDGGAPTLYRYLYPTLLVTLASDAIAVAAINSFVWDGATVTTTINSLQAATTDTSTTLCGRDAIIAAPGTDALMCYTEYLAVAPVPTYPLNNEIIPVNSISGFVNAFIFRWDCPPAVPTLTYYNFDVLVYADEAGTILVGNITTAGVFFGGGTASTPSGLGGTFAPVPGTTYYWRVRVTAGQPLQSFWSPMQTFTIQQLAAIVPEIASPPTGSTVESLTPAFSWGPIAGVATYRFELAKEPEFALIVYTADVTSSSAALPVATTLERGKTYFWRVKALTPAEGEWSEVGIFTVAEEEPTPSPTPTITPTFTVPMPTIYATVTAPQPTVTVVIPTTTEAPVEEIATAYIWAIIIIGAVLVIAVIVLIVRTRRTV
jgi:hypothetical protein